MIKPALLARPCGLPTSPGGTEVPRPLATLVRGIGARDIAIGTAMAFAPRGTALRVATAARVSADLADAFVFGSQPADRVRRMKMAGFAAGWALLCAVSARWAG
jgi:hypothetical protein